jgi:hypothetical protein
MAFHVKGKDGAKAERSRAQSGDSIGSFTVTKKMSEWW